MPDLRDQLGLLEQTDGRPPKPCRTAQLFKEIDADRRKKDSNDDSAEILRRLVEETQVGLKAIRQALVDSGINPAPAWTTLKNHRDRNCSCGVKA